MNLKNTDSIITPKTPPLLSSKNNALPFLNVALVGGGEVCYKVLKYFNNKRLSLLNMKIAGVADVDKNSPGFVLAKELNIFTAADFKDFYRINGLNLIVALTGSDKIGKEILRTKPEDVSLMEKSCTLESPVSISGIINDEPLINTLKQIQSGEHAEDKSISQEIEVGKNVLRAISAPVLDPDKSVVGTVTVLENITAFKQLDQMKTDFVNMVAHELRSPLVSIRQLNNVLLDGLAGPLEEKQEDFINRGVKKIDVLLELINDLLDVAG